MLGSLITSKTRLRILLKFFVNAANESHMRGLAGEFGESTNAIRKELNNLSDAGYLEKEVVGKQINYKANVSHPLFKPLQALVRQFLGFDAIVESVLERMGEVRQVWLVGDYAKGVDSGEIEVVIVGGDLNAAYTEQLAKKVEGLIDRKVHFYLETSFSKPGLLIYEETINE